MDDEARKTIQLNTAQGSLIGTCEETVFKKPYFKFQGIPYAKPPIGDLRFKIDPSNPLPVMVYIHGGGLETFAGVFSMFPPDYLINENVVLVLVNYRLSSFGFLSSHDETLDICENAGLKDQALALKWINQNIEFFGGDQDSVTIFSYSASSECCFLLFLSPLTKGLIHRVICQSGPLDLFWYHKRGLYEKLLEKLDIDESMDKMNKFKLFCSKDPKAILEAFYKTKEKSAEDPNYSGILIERNTTKSPIINKSPVEIIEKNEFPKIPIMIGNCANEFGFLLKFPDKYRVKIDFKNNEDLNIPLFNFERGSDKSIEIGDKIKKFYYGDKVPSKDLEKEFLDYLLDSYIFYPNVRYSKKLCEKTDVYFYEFNYRAINDIDEKTKYVSHEDDVKYLFYKPGTIDPTKPMPSSVYRMVKLWTNFAKYGNPNSIEKDDLIDVNWTPVNKNQLNCLKIDEHLECDSDFAKERIEFWDKIYKNLNL